MKGLVHTWSTHALRYFCNSFHRGKNVETWVWGICVKTLFPAIDEKGKVDAGILIISLKPLKFWGNHLFFENIWLDLFNEFLWFWWKKIIIQFAWFLSCWERSLEVIGIAFGATSLSFSHWSYFADINKEPESMLLHATSVKSQPYFSTFFAKLKAW